MATGAVADFGIPSDGFTMSVVDQAGSPENRAGSHPDRLLIGFKFTTTDGKADENPKDMVVDLPPGLVGNPRAIPACAREHLSPVLFDEVTCPPESQIGIATLNILGFGAWTTRIFNADPSTDAVAEFAFSTSLANAIKVHLRTDGQGFELKMSSAVQDLQLESAVVELWGVPADHQTSGSAPRRPFLTTATRCDGQVFAGHDARELMATPRCLGEFNNRGGASPSRVRRAVVSTAVSVRARQRCR